MGKLGNLLVSIAALGALFAWAINREVPEGFEEPWKYKLFASSIALVIQIDWTLQCYGFNSIIENASPPAISPTPPFITREENYLAGVRSVIYRPVGALEDLPALVYYHGGGWVMGSPEQMHEFSVDLVSDLDIILVSVDYRLAPEHPYPAPFEDCYKVAEYVINYATQFKVDPNRISLGGDSAGAHLAAAVATKLKDEGLLPKIRMQLLLYPVLQPYDFQTSSFKRRKVSREMTARVWNKYALGNADLYKDMVDNAHVIEEERQDFNKLCENSELLSQGPTLTVKSDTWSTLKPFLKDPYFCPLVAKNLTSMPPTIMVTVENDVLKDDGFLYAQRLQKSGVNIIHLHLEYSMHGIYSFKPFFHLDYKKAYDNILPHIRKLL